MLPYFIESFLTGTRPERNRGDETMPVPGSPSPSAARRRLRSAKNFGVLTTLSRWHRARRQAGTYVPGQSRRGLHLPWADRTSVRFGPVWSPATSIVEPIRSLDRPQSWCLLDFLGSGVICYLLPQPRSRKRTPPLRLQRKWITCDCVASGSRPRGEVRRLAARGNATVNRNQSQDPG
jgi:hypothetical protein